MTVRPLPRPRRTRPSTAVVARVFAFGICGLAAAAHAECDAVLAAYAKADATRRFAIYDVPGMAAQPKGAAFFTDIDGQAFTDIGTGPQRAASGHALDERDALQKRVKQGAARCEPLGERKVGNEAVVGYRIRKTGAGDDITAIHFWIAKASGLPLYHSMGEGSGFRWVYGTAVTAPVMAKR